MFVSNVGGIIAAASKESAHPLRKTGKIPAIKRIVLSMQQAGLFPIVVVVGADDYESRYQLNNLNVVFLILEESDEKRELFHSVKAGLSYLQDKCLSVVFTPVNAPMFIPKTIVEMRKYHDDIVVPSYKKKAGHPVLISNEMIPDILAYDGENGLRGAIEKYAGRRVFVEGSEVKLTAKEYDLLELLSFHPNKVYSRENLLNIVWGYDYPGDVRTVDVHIRRLREKIEKNPGEPLYIHTKWGVGYYFQD